jgi:hypothetical protein
MKDKKKMTKDDQKQSNIVKKKYRASTQISTLLESEKNNETTKKRKLSNSPPQSSTPQKIIHIEPIQSTLQPIQTISYETSQPVYTSNNSDIIEIPSDQSLNKNQNYNSDDVSSFDFSNIIIQNDSVTSKCIQPNSNKKSSKTINNDEPKRLIPIASNNRQSYPQRLNKNFISKQLNAQASEQNTPQRSGNNILTNIYQQSPSSFQFNTGMNNNNSNNSRNQSQFVIPANFAGTVLFQPTIHIHTHVGEKSILKEMMSNYRSIVPKITKTISANNCNNNQNQK